MDEFLDQLLAALIVTATPAPVVTTATAARTAAAATPAAARSARATAPRLMLGWLLRLGRDRSRLGNRRSFLRLGAGFVVLLILVLHS
jgi:hypothetical protein